MKNRLLRELPSVDELIRNPAFREASSQYSRALLTEAARIALAEVRGLILSGEREEVPADEITGLVFSNIKAILRPRMVKVINATGTVLHTNMGRAVLSPEAVEALQLAAGFNTNLEIDLRTGDRGVRDSLVEDHLKRLTGAEAVSVVNNNAAAVFIALNTLAEGKEVIISRGEIIEIGGSFRLHEIIKKSGCVLKEVGTTNRTHPADYEKAMTDQTAVIFKAHKSNFSVSGFTSEVGLKELVEIGRKRGVPVIEDLGSGALLDLSAWGLPKETVVGESVSAGADCVTFSGDKLLGGPQAGLIVGRAALINRINSNPLKRALRADKLTLSALEATLRLYLNPESLPKTLPVLRYMTRGVLEIDAAARKAGELLKAALGKDFAVIVEDSESVVGGGSLPEHNLPTKVVAITHKTITPGKIFRLFLDNNPPIMGRVGSDKFMLDLRTVEDPRDLIPGTALKTAAGKM